MTYRIRFWYWHQEVIIKGITAEELVNTIFYPNACDEEHPQVIKNAEIHGYDEDFDKKYPIEVVMSEDARTLRIHHLNPANLEELDTTFKTGELDEKLWILEEER